MWQPLKFTFVEHKSKNWSGRSKGQREEPPWEGGLGQTVRERRRWAGAGETEHSSRGELSSPPSDAALAEAGARREALEQRTGQ